MQLDILESVYSQSTHVFPNMLVFLHFSTFLSLASFIFQSRYEIKSGRLCTLLILAFNRTCSSSMTIISLSCFFIRARIWVIILSTPILDSYHALLPKFLNHLCLVSLIFQSVDCFSFKIPLVLSFKQTNNGGNYTKDSTLVETI